METAVRKIPIQYTNSSSIRGGSDITFLPLKINSASVIPVIFAQSIMTAPQIIISFFNTDLYRKLSSFLSLNGWVGLTIYAVLTVLFTFFYTELQVDPEKIRAKGMESVRSRVTNIRRYLKEDVPLFAFREMLLAFIRRGTESEEYAFSEKDLREIERIKQERYDTWEWNYGKSPECSILKSARVEGCGIIEVYLETDHSLITDVSFRGDFFSTRDPEELIPNFIGKKPDADGFSQALEGIDVEKFFAGLTKEQLLSLLSGS